MLSTGLAPTDFVGRLLCVPMIQAKGLWQPLPSQEAQSTEGRPAKNPPKEENVQKCYVRGKEQSQSFIKNVGVILLDLGRR